MPFAFFAKPSGVPVPVVKFSAAFLNDSKMVRSISPEANNLLTALQNSTDAPVLKKETDYLEETSLALKSTKS